MTTTVAYGVGRGGVNDDVRWVLREAKVAGVNKRPNRSYDGVEALPWSPGVYMKMAESGMGRKWGENEEEGGEKEREREKGRGNWTVSTVHRTSAERVVPRWQTKNIKPREKDRALAAVLYW